MNTIPEITISYSSKVNLSNAPIIKGSLDAADILLSGWDDLEVRESFKILLLNRANKVKAIYEVSRGGVSATVVDPKLVFAVALKTLSSAIILCHNHPSGNLMPSNADIQLTKKLVSGAKLLEMNVLDHIILSPEGDYYSFADESLI